MNNLSRKEQFFYGPAIPLLNSGNWNPDLHPRDSIGEFIYTDGGRHGKSASAAVSTTSPQITIPPHPANANITLNMQIASNLGKQQSLYVALNVFKSLVKTRGPWDYKNQPTLGANPDISRVFMGAGRRDIF
jgi:hypothetical protein